MAAVMYLATLFILQSCWFLEFAGRKGCEGWVIILNSMFLEVFTIGCGILSGLK